MTTRGGRIPPDGRPAQAKGVGRNAKRHDLERPATPGLHDSDLQQGDVQAMEQGQRVAPASTQQRGQTPAPASGGGPATGRMQQAGQSGGIQIPDPIDFLGDTSRNGQDFNLPQPRRQIDESKALTWLPILRMLANGPGSSPALVNAFINQARLMSQNGGQPATIVDMHAADDGIEEMLDFGIMPEIGRQTMEQAPDGTETSSMQLPDQEPVTKEPSGVE